MKVSILPSIKEIFIQNERPLFFSKMSWFITTQSGDLVDYGLFDKGNTNIQLFNLSAGLYSFRFNGQVYDFHLN